MKIRIVTPAPAGSRSGNRVTAERWGRILRGLGHRVVIEEEYRGSPCNLLVALHARRSARSASRFKREHPGSPLIVALTGTDLYCDLPASRPARRTIELADRLIVLQPLALAKLPPAVRARTRVVFQSVPRPAPAGRHGRSLGLAVRRSVHPPDTVNGTSRATIPDAPGAAAAGLLQGRRLRHRSRPAGDFFPVCVAAHLRTVKDPLRTARAARLLPSSSRILVVHIGGVRSKSMGRRARLEAERNPRYVWLGERPRAEALRILAACRLLVVSSKAEGGANVVSEALASSVPVLSSRIPGSVGLLGRDYPGYFRAGGTRALASLLRRAETDPRFYEDLKRRCRRRAPLVDPARERRSWRAILSELRRGS